MSFQALLNQFLQSPGAKGAAGGALSGAAVSLLMNKKARNTLGNTVVKVGGAAAIAGVGYYAYKKWQEAKGQSTVGTPQKSITPLPASNQPSSMNDQFLELPVSESLAGTMVKAMIATALADNQLQPEQIEQIQAALDNPVLSAQEVKVLTAALNNPPSIFDIAAEVNGLEQASEVYGACLTVVEPGNMAESMFLRRLARALSLPADLVDSMHNSLR